MKDDPRILLVHSWNKAPLPAEHGFPLRVYIPGVYGMKQPKWIVGIDLVASDEEGYWVTRGWNRQAVMRTTSVIDTVAVSQPIDSGGTRLIPVGGIAFAGDRGISRVEVQVDNGPWVPARLRAPLSGLTWVIWRYDWPFQAGHHTFQVRTFDGAGTMQDPKSGGAYPAGATGLSFTSI